MTVFIASGDCGAFTDRVDGDRSVSFPASDPDVVAVGGELFFRWIRISIVREK